MTVQRWKCTSYCLCGSRKGHFEKSDDEGVWVRYEAAHALEQQNEQLRGNLSLAEEGLANYAQENAQLRDAMKSAERLFNTLCFDMPDWVGRNEEVCGPFRVALNGEICTRGAVPQSREHET